MSIQTARRGKSASRRRSSSAKTVNATDSAGLTDSTVGGMPIGDLANWTQVFAEDFGTASALGTFTPAVGGQLPVGHPYRDRLTLYEDGIDDTSHNAKYYPSRTVSVSGGTLKIFCHYDSGLAIAVAAQVAPNPGFWSQTYGKYTFRSRAIFNGPLYGGVWQLIDSPTWPLSGESDAVEGDFATTADLGGNYHPAQAGNEFTHYEAGPTIGWDTWHTWDIEWSPGHEVWKCDGVVYMDRIARISTMDRTFMFQCGSNGSAPATGTSGTFEIDWMVVYSYAGGLTAPSATVSETFTGSNGAAWPSPKWTINNPSGTTDIQSNTGRIQPAVGVYTNGASAYLAGMYELTDVELLCDLKFNATVIEQYPAIALRSAGDMWTSGGDAGLPASGFTVIFAPSANQFWVDNAWTSATIGGPFSFTFAAGATYGLRMKLIDDDIWVRFWNKSGAEPGTWNYTGTGTADWVTAGRLIVTSSSGGSGAACPVFIDNVSITAA